MSSETDNAHQAHLQSTDVSCDSVDDSEEDEDDDSIFFPMLPKQVDEEDEDDDPAFDWRRPELAPYLPYVDKDTEAHKNLPRLSLGVSWIDLNQIVRWLKLCDELHGPHCGGRLSPGDDKRTSPRWLIDVQRLCIAPASPPSEYFALSYVWGRVLTLHATKANLKRLQEENSLKDLEAELPNTINDAIFLTRQLGGTHLWVDQLCIPQDDDDFKLLELSAMAAIYRNAYATIVAAQGQDANEGLHGVRSVRRLPYKPREEQEDFEWWHSFWFSRKHRTLTLARPPRKAPRHMTDREAMQRFGRVLLRTTWYSRGWTFQEQLFSPRKIIFHNDTVNWECHCATFHEAQDVSDTSGLGLCRRPRTQTETAFIDSTTWPNFHRYARLVALYNQRSLTRAEDVLDAFEGVLSKLVHVFEGGFVSGLPSLFFDASLLWQPYEPVKRRVPSGESSALPVLPSWSWIGWQGNLNSESWRSGYDYLRRINVSGIYSYKPDLSSPLPVPCSWHTIPTVQWSYSATTTGERTHIQVSSGWRRKIHGYATLGHHDLPAGWTRHLDPQYGFVFKHKSEPEQEFMYPIPLRDQSHTPPPPVRARFLHCRTRRTHLRFGEHYESRSASHCTVVDLLDEKGAWAGALRLNYILLAFQNLQEHLQGDSCELIELSAGSVWNQEVEEISIDEWHRPGCPRTHGLYEFYNVMWVERSDGIAYRKAVGRVEKSVWERVAVDEADITIG